MLRTTLLVRLLVRLLVPSPRPPIHSAQRPAIQPLTRTLLEGAADDVLEPTEPARWLASVSASISITAALLMGARVDAFMNDPLRPLDRPMSSTPSGPASAVSESVTFSMTARKWETYDAVGSSWVNGG